MRIFSKILKKFSIPFSILAFICMGIGFNLPAKGLDAKADFSPQKQIVNSLPEYVKFEYSTDAGKEVNFVDNSVYLFLPDSTKSLIIADEEKENPDEAGGKNYAYFPDPNVNTVFYYFDFTSSLSLYYNVTSSDVQAEVTTDNILKNQDISSYAKQHSEPFKTTTSTPPKQFKITFKLNTLAKSDTFSDETITLYREGLYTLAIPTLEYYTANNGISFMMSEKTIYYSFMIFNSETYFETSTSKPRIDHSNNVQESSLNASSSYSAYYFYNYAYSKEINTLPSLSYDPDRFQIRVTYTDINEKNSSTIIEYRDGEPVQLNDLGNELAESDKFVRTVLKDKKVNIIFSSLGTYDIDISYLYKNGTDTYNLQFEKLVKQTKDGDNLILSPSNFKNKQQRLFIYGYQAAYSNYSDIDPSTNQPRSVDLKTFDDFDKYEKSADITSIVNNFILNYNENDIEKEETEQDPKATGVIDAQNPSTSLSSGFDQNALYEYAKKAIEKGGADGKELEPVTTNQTPIKFLTNVKNNRSFSKIYTLTLNEKGEKVWQNFNDAKSFEDFNQNTAGTYLYIIQYTYDNFMSTSGTLQSSYYHYQIFYFTVTNSSPTVEVINEDFQRIYTNGFTNKSVYILNDAENNIFDAQVLITLTAQNYKTGEYYFRDEDIKNLTNFDLQYTQFNKKLEEKDTSNYNKYIAGKYGIYINNTSRIANSKFTIKITSANSNVPSTRTFTIDTDQIEHITSRNVNLVSSTVYRIGDTFTSYNTNQPFVLSWDEKASGAKTYGFVTYIPTKQINYYSKDENGIQDLLSKFIDHNILPVSYCIDFKNASEWTEQPNSLDYNTTIPATYVKTSDGFYILEVYDDAGNSNFQIFLIDSSAPIFIEEIQGKLGNTNKILTNSESISIPEENDSVFINWSAYKAIYLEHLDDIYNLKAYKYGVDVESANTKLTNLINEFFNKEDSEKIRNINNISTSVEDSVGISSYNGDYLIIPISEIAYIKNGFASDYSPFKGTRYQVKFFDDNGQSADNKTFKILIRDKSNTQTATNQDLQYKNYPSGFISFNVTADASRMMLKFTQDNSNVEFSSFSFDGKLYSYTDENGNTVYTYQSSDKDKEYTETEKNYKFSYYTPINGLEELFLSYIPVAKNGSELESVNLKYYPYIKKHLEFLEDTKKNKYGDSNYYWYYTLSEEATQTVNIFTASDDDNFEEDQTKTFDLQLGNDIQPLAGKYVIERTYKEGTTVGTYDYYSRTLSIVIDNNNLISPLESVTGAESSGSLESLVGGDIILSLYSGEGNSTIEVSFPKYSIDTGLSIGSFHTKDSFEDTDTIERFSVNGNKLPMMLYIPKYKYTIASVRSEKNGTIGYEVEHNNALSTYGDTYYKYNDKTREYEVFVEGILVETFTNETEAKNYIKSASIVEYQIYAEISFTSSNSSIPRYYATDASNYLDNGKGYLRFFEANGHFGSINLNSELREIYQKGTYVVTIYQASNAGTKSKFYTLYKFGFEIISQAPSFDVQNADMVSLSNTSQPNIYYTNSKFLTFTWQIPTNEYQARIDEENISIVTTPRNLPFSYTSTDGNGGYIVDNNGSKYFTIDVSNLLAIDNSSISVTMQYYGHNEKYYYSTLTKTIYFDIGAPTQNLQYLMNLTESATNRTISTNYQLLYMRSYKNYNDEEVSLNSLSNLKNMSYTYSLDTGYFKYFSYNVTTDFFKNNLRQTIINATNDNYGTQNVFYRKVDNLNSYTQVDKNSFTSGNYYYITANGELQLTKGYYEIVETDYAGNMTVYLVNLINSTDTEDDDTSTSAFTYENNILKEEGKNRTVDESELYEGVNIYSRSGFNITSITYKSDSWEFFTLQLADGNAVRYMKSPWLDNSQIYQLSFPNGGLAFNQRSLSSLFENVESSSRKHTLTLTDRVTGSSITIYITIMDATLSWNKVADLTKTSAILNINIPTPAQIASTKDGYIYPVKISIFQFDKENAENPWKSLIVATQDPYLNWEPKIDYITFANIQNNTVLQIVINLGDKASQKIKYVIEDNFGSNITVIQLANEVSYREISGESIVYTINESEDETITYLSSDNIHFSYNQLLYKVVVFDRQGVKLLDENTQSESIISFIDYNTNITKLTFTHGEHFYDEYYKVVVYDSESNDELRTLHIRIYNKLPFRTDNTDNVANGGIIFLDKDHKPIEEANIGSIPNYSVNFNGKDYFATCETITTFSRNVTLRFYDGGLLNYDSNYSYKDGYPYTVYLSSDDGITWENINNVNSDYTGYTVAGVGDYKILIKYDNIEYDGVQIFPDLCRIFTITILDSSTASYYITVDGNIVERNTEKYYSVKEDKEYEINYIVSVDYSDKANRLRITENKELKGKVSLLDVENTGSDVIVEKYFYTSTTGENYFAIIYIAETNNIVQTFTYESPYGAGDSLKDKNSETIAVNNVTEANYDRLKLIFSSYYGIKTNKVNVEIQKLFNGQYVEIESQVYVKDDSSSFIYLNRAGSYRIRIYDSCSPANVQTFTGSRYFNLTFLNYVPFIVSQTKGSGTDAVTTVTEPINKAVYNGNVTIQPTNVSTYYQQSRTPQLNVTLNGNAYTDYETGSNRRYTFSQPGFYTIKFSATSISGIPIREQEFSFTILNENESRYAYEFTEYSTYYIEKVEKIEGVGDQQVRNDITQRLLDITNFDRIIVDGVEHLAEININYKDEKTQKGRYSITVNINDPDIKNLVGERFTFDFWINMEKPPVIISVEEGKKTTDDIRISINVQNLYNAVGDCYLTVSDLTREYNAKTLSSYSTVDTVNIVASGTFFIQIYSASGQLLFSYKVIKTEPLNAFAIIAIIVGILGVGAVITITILLRKKQKVK